MSTGHHHRSAAPGLNSQALDRLLEDKQLREKLHRYRETDRSFDLPYLGGYSKDGGTVYIDRHLPDQLEVEMDGRKRSINPVEFLRMHECFEKACIDALGYSYDGAHQAATGYERRAVLTRLGPSWWVPYSDALKPYIKADEHEKLVSIPPDLDWTPYLSPPVNHELVERMQAAQGAQRKHSKAEAKYTDMGSRTEHCSICEHYQRPRACELVRGAVSPQGWCKYWEACDDD